jgi:hypothetical protein
MKKFLLIIAVFLLGMRLSANPKPGPPSIHISEFVFDTPDKWQLEMEFRYFEYYDMNIEKYAFAIIISGDTLLGSVFSYSFHSGNLCTFSSDSFNLSKSLNLTGDTITILPFYYDDIDFVDGKYVFADVQYFSDYLQLIFGNCEGSVIQAPKIGQSIALRESYYSDDDFYVIDNTPTIGNPNDDNGVFGTMQGVFYDKNSLSVANRSFRLMGIDFSTDENGNYSTSVYAKRSEFSSIQYDYSPSQYQYVPIDEISFEIYPDSVIERDIYIRGTLFTSINEMKMEEKFPIRFFPNPVSTSGMLQYETDLPVLSSNMSLHLFSIDGKLIQSHKIINSSGEIQVAQAAGIYRIVLKMDDKIIASKSILVE